MNKKGSIYKKIMNRTLLIALMSMLLVCVLSYATIQYVRDSVINTSEELGVSAARDSMQTLEDKMEEALQNLARNKAARSDEKLAQVAMFVEMISENASDIASNPDKYGESIVQFPDAANEGVVVSQLRYAPNVSPEILREETLLMGNIQNALKLICAHSDSVRSSYIGTESGISLSADADSAQKTNVFEPRDRPWYMAAKEQNKLIWSDVFRDKTGRGMTITCAKPYYGGNGEIKGVAGLGMLLDNLSAIVVETNVGKTGYAFISNEKGEIIISNDIKDDGGSLTSNALNQLLSEETASRITNGESAIEKVTVDGKECFIAYEPLKTLPWSLSIVISVDEVVEPAVASEANIIEMKNNALSKINSIITIITLLFVAFIAAAVILNIYFSRKLAGKLAEPIIRLSKGAEIIGDGDLNHRFDIKTNDELETLSDTFNVMIDNIKSITAEKERVGAELNVATKIQASMLPSIFPPFPNRTEFDIYAKMIPAKEVGGDFYDFFLIDETHLCVVIADVSGKGVPAALFMVIAKTLIKNSATYGNCPKKVFETVNNQLCEGNEAGMFVTAFLGILDITTGEFIYANAGHNPPLVKKKGDTFQWLKSKPGFVLAGMENIKYRQYETTLTEGDVLFLYTDGVTEAMNQKLELFSDKRLENSLNHCTEHSPKELTSAIKSEIDAFAKGAEQTDDITVLVLKIKETSNSGGFKELVIPASLDSLPSALEFVTDGTELDAKTKTQIDTAVEEIFVNIARYAYAPETGDATIRVKTEGGVMTIEFSDKGKPFNPLEKPDPDTSASADDRNIGGLGIFMVKKMMDSAMYRHEDGRNVLTLTKGL